MPGRTPAGRFAPGVSGNPAGRPKGSRNKASFFAEAMRAGEGVELARRCLDEAQDGNSVSLRFCLGRIEPARRGRPVTLDLLPGEEREVHAVLARALRAVAAGELTPEEAYWIGRLAALKRATPLQDGLPNEPWDTLDPQKWEWEGAGEPEAEESEGEAQVASSPRLRGEAGGGDPPPSHPMTGLGLLPQLAPPPRAEEAIAISTATCFPPVFSGGSAVLAAGLDGRAREAAPVLLSVFSGGTPPFRFRTTGQGGGL